MGIQILHPLRLCVQDTDPDLTRTRLKRESRRGEEIGSGVAEVGIYSRWSPKIPVVILWYFLFMMVANIARILTIERWKFF